MDHIRRGTPSPSPLIFLHGLFGGKEDWLPVISHLEDCHDCIAIDLPFCKEEFPPSSILIGYSMGGRIALLLAPFFSKVLLISAHLNNLTPEERTQREMWDKRWQEKLLTLPPLQFFTEWYDQPLFASLSPTLRTTLIQTRATQDPASFLPLFSNMSLLKQPPFSSLPKNVSLIFGKKDSQYEKMYRSISDAAISIPESGHMCHLENPQGCARAIERCLET